MGIDAEGARQLVASVLDESPSGRWLAATEATRLLSAYGIPVLRPEAVGDPNAAVAAAERTGWPVALKAGSPAIVHKIDEGAVALGLGGPRDLERAWASMADRLGERMGGGIVQAMAPPGAVETIVGAVQDPAFGPLVLFGAGGSLAEISGDRQLASAPLTDVEARDLVEATRVHRLLCGYRGRPPADIEAVVDTVLRVARLASELPEVAELDVNPLNASGSGVVGLDVKVRVAPVPAHPELTVRRLR